MAKMCASLAELGDNLYNIATMHALLHLLAPDHRCAMERFSLSPDQDLDPMAWDVFGAMEHTVMMMFAQLRASGTLAGASVGPALDYQQLVADFAIEGAPFSVPDGIDSKEAE
jgi:hypothetical protein